MAVVVRMDRFNDYTHYDVILQRSFLHVTVTASTLVASNWVKSMLSEPQNVASFNAGEMVAGLSIRWSPSSNNRDRVPSTLQLCVHNRCLIFQLCRAERFLAPKLRNFLRNSESVTFVGFWNLYLRHLLSVSYHAIKLGSDPLDLRNFMNDAELANGSFQNIAQTCLNYYGVRTTLDVEMSNWGGENLSDQQVLEASMEVRCANLIGQDLEVWNLR